MRTKAPLHRAPAAGLALWLIAALGVVALGLVTAACGDSEPARGRAVGSALWVEPETLPGLGSEDRETLFTAGVRELFLDAGRVGEEGRGVPDDLLAAMPRAARRGAGSRLPVTLVVFGPWNAASDTRNPREAGRDMAAGLAALRRSAEARGLTPVGYHLDVDVPGDEAGAQRFADALAALREVLDEGSGGDVLLSVTATPQALAGEGFPEVAEEVDFLVAYLYGARDEERPAPSPERAWSLAAAESAIERLGELREPYLLGLGTAGRLERLGGDGGVVATTRGASLPDLVARRGLEPGFVGLDTGFRQRIAFRVEEALRLGDWTLRPGDRVQVVRPAVSHLRALATSADRVTPDTHLGEVYDRLPRAGEELSLGLAAVAAAAGAAEPRLELRAELVPEGRGRSRLRLRLHNEGLLASDVALLETNYLDLRALGGATVAGAQAGDFQRYQLQHEGRRVRDMRSLRSADTVRFYLPLSQPGEVVESGTVVLSSPPSSGPVARVTGRFAVPGGGEVEVEAGEWPTPEPEPGDGTEADR